MLHLLLLISFVVGPLAGLLYLITRVSHRARITEPQCANCGYIVHGLESNRCPECGTVLDEKTIIRPGDRQPLGRLFRATAWSFAVYACYVVITNGVWIPFYETLNATLPGTLYRIDSFTLMNTPARRKGSSTNLWFPTIDVITTGPNPAQSPPMLVLFGWGITSNRPLQLLDDVLVIDPRAGLVNERKDLPGFDRERGAKINPATAKPLTREILSAWRRRQPVDGSNDEIDAIAAIVSDLSKPGPWDRLFAATRSDVPTLTSTGLHLVLLRSGGARQQPVRPITAVQLSLWTIWLAGIIVIARTRRLGKEMFQP